MNFSWEKIHFDQWLRDSRYPEGRWRSFLSLVSSPLMPSSRALCSCLTCGVLLFIPSYVLWHRNPPSRLAEDLPFPLTPRMLFTPPLAPRNGSQVLGPHHKTVTSGFHDCPPPREWQANSSGGIHRYSCAPLAHTWAGSWGRGAGCWKGRVPHRLTVFPSSTSWWHLSWGF